MNEEENKDVSKNPAKIIRKMKTIGSVGSVIFKIFSIFALIAALASFIGFIVVPFIPWADIQDGIIKYADPSSDLSWVKNLSIKNGEVVCSFGFVNGVVSMFLMHYSDKLFANFKDEGTPFRNDNVVILNKIGIVSLVQAIAVPTVLSIITAATRTESLFQTSWNGVSIAIGLLVFLLSLVFKYGVSLQEQVDTTL